VSLYVCVCYFFLPQFLLLLCANRASQCFTDQVYISLTPKVLCSLCDGHRFVQTSADFIYVLFYSNDNNKCNSVTTSDRQTSTIFTRFKSSGGWSAVRYFGTEIEDSLGCSSKRFLSFFQRFKMIRRLRYFVNNYRLTTDYFERLNRI